MSNIDWRNWEEYYRSFCQAFLTSVCEMRTDPDRFPRDERNGNGFWISYPLTGIRGSFTCSEVPDCSWKSKDIQVDVMFRYNFEQKRGEVKIVKEYRQRCGVHGGSLVEPVFFGEPGGAKEIMRRVRGYIRGRFYKERRPGQSRTRFTSTGSSVSSGVSVSVSSRSTNTRYDANNNVTVKRNTLPYYKPVPDHQRHNCEACMLSRCPLVFRSIARDQQHCVKGNTFSKETNLDFIQWALLDGRGEPHFAI